MSQDIATVYVVDDDESVGVSLCRLLMSAGLEAVYYQDAEQFLEEIGNTSLGCLLLDIRMPKISGLEIQKIMNDQGTTLPIVFITGHGDIPMSVRAIKDGAVNFLTKPFDDVEVIDAVNSAIELHRKILEKEHSLNEIENHYKQLTAREKEVFELVITGLLNKQIAFQLGIVEKTIKVHRSRIMDKMKANNFADLVKMGVALQIGEQDNHTNA
ncbi:response regulator transcription factor [Pseudomaricurvus alkylphenolicus]|uniref:response regulator transcription factor n=1 Tax=Pseudomaricurvus alkylphenolicus TaxID=1306991 RepID=UPI00142052F2|nr:response regulator [Pseudomaricurvus alkylphenolicus]NIB38718.1 response regulator transcription factor [Pseudomaricurvus alkylphenolicus]